MRSLSITIMIAAVPLIATAFGRFPGASSGAARRRGTGPGVSRLVFFGPLLAGRACRVGPGDFSVVFSRPLLGWRT